MVDVNTQFGGFLTDLGAAKNANANALGVPWKLTHMLIGDASGTDPVPAPGQTALVNQVYRAQLNQLYVSPTDANVLIAELVLPPNVGGWWIRELALEDEDGVFSAVANCAPSYKPVLAQGSGRNQVVRMHVITSGTANIQLKIDPSVVLATRAYCDGLIAAHGAAANPHPQYALRGDVVTLSATAAITPAQLGLVLLDASGGNRIFTLPAANAALGVREVTLRRVDVSSNALVIAASGADKLMLDTTAEAAGQVTTELLFAGDYLRLRSDGAGKWWCVGQAQLPGSINSGLVSFATPGVHLFTVPAVLRSGRRIATVTVVGGGGGGEGGPSGSSSGAGGGGGAGATAQSLVNLATVISVPVTVGTGGSGNIGPGGNGGVSSFGSSVSAGGGGGAGVTSSSGVGGRGSANAVGSVITPGGDGQNSFIRTLSGFYYGGVGGSSSMGGGSGGASSVTGTVAIGAGGGGNSGAAGLQGGNGLVLIEW